MSLIPATYGYYIEKVYEGISSDRPLGSVNLNMIKQTHQNIKDGISQRYGGEDVLESTKLITDKIDYVLGKLTTYFADEGAFQKRDAEVFFDAFNGYFKEMRDILAEIDKEFLFSRVFAAQKEIFASSSMPILDSSNVSTALRYSTSKDIHNSMVEELFPLPCKGNFLAVSSD